MEPAIILVRPQLGMNIGMVARAMANFGLSDLRLVAPRDGWPNPDAGPPAAGADHVLDSARVFATVSEALADCHHTYATAFRPRDLPKPVRAPRDALREMRSSAGKPGILFGPERSGLATDDLATVQTLVTIPANPDFASLNLAQSVLVMAYEWFLADAPTVASPVRLPAPLADLEGMLGQLNAALAGAGYFFPPHRTRATQRTLAGIMTAARFTADEIRTLRGVIRALARSREG